MKILLINNIGIDYAGVEVMVRQLKEGLQKQGHDVRVFAGDIPDSPQRFSDYTFRSFRDDSIIRFFLFILNPFAIWSLYRTLKVFQPDVVHLHTITNTSPFILPLLKDIPTVLTIHYHMVFDPTRFEDSPNLKILQDALPYYFISDRKNLRYYGEKIRFFFFRRFYKNIDTVVSCSNFYAEAARESKLFNEVIVIHNGIKLLPFVSIKNNNNILYVGRIDRSKGVDILLQAMPEVIRQIPGASLTIVGDGVFKVFCQTLSEELHIEDHVHFLGYKNHKDANELLADATIAVVPSIFPDNFPTVCIEAMSVGRPVIGSRIGGIPEMILDRKTGFLINPGDSQLLASALIELIQNPAQCTAFGQAGRNYAEANFSTETYIHNTLGVYKKLITS